MSQRTRKPRSLEHLETYRMQSGWYLAAWRDFKGLTLEDLAESLGRTKGYVSDLETGQNRKGRPATRYNRNLVDDISSYFGITAGQLLDTNPFRNVPEHSDLISHIQNLDAHAAKSLIEIAKLLANPSDRDTER